MSIFQKALKNKYRYEFKGLISTEDLFDLSVEALDEIYKGLISKKKQSEEESLLSKKTAEQSTIDDKIEIIKSIVSDKLEEKEKRLKAKERKEKRNQLLAALQSREEQELLNKSPDEIRKMLEELED